MICSLFPLLSQPLVWSLDCLSGGPSPPLSVPLSLSSTFSYSAGCTSAGSTMRCSIWNSGHRAAGGVCESVVKLHWKSGRKPPTKHPTSPGTGLLCHALSPFPTSETLFMVQYLQQTNNGADKYWGTVTVLNLCFCVWHDKRRYACNKLLGVSVSAFAKGERWREWFWSCHLQ